MQKCSGLRHFAALARLVSLLGVSLSSNKTHVGAHCDRTIPPNLPHCRGHWRVEP